MSELAATSQPPTGTDRKSWLVSEWERLLAEQVQKVVDAWPGRKVPPVAQWDGLVATRVKTLRRLMAAPELVPKFATAQSGPGFPWIERKLEDPASGVFGTPDRVDVRDGQLRVVDLKSGVHQIGIQDHQRRQLLLYAHLVDVECGQLPAVGVIVDVAGKETSFTIDSMAVTGAVQDAQMAISEFNIAAAAGNVMARPDEVGCRFCAFRSVCWTYWNSAVRSERDVRGTVLDEPGINSFKIDTGAADLLRVVLTSGCQTPVAGDDVLVLDTDTAGPNTVRMRWNSVIRTAAAG